jgi:hypothetical protein
VKICDLNQKKEIGELKKTLTQADNLFTWFYQYLLCYPLC